MPLRAGNAHRDVLVRLRVVADVGDRGAERRQLGEGRLPRLGQHCPVGGVPVEGRSDDESWPRFAGEAVRGGSALGGGFGGGGRPVGGGEREQEKAAALLVHCLDAPRGTDSPAASGRRIAVTPMARPCLGAEATRREKRNGCSTNRIVAMAGSAERATRATAIGHVTSPNQAWVRTRIGQCHR